MTSPRLNCPYCCSYHLLYYDHTASEWTCPILLVRVFGVRDEDQSDDDQEASNLNTRRFAIPKLLLPMIFLILAATSRARAAS